MQHLYRDANGDLYSILVDIAMPMRRLCHDLLYSFGRFFCSSHSWGKAAWNGADADILSLHNSFGANARCDSSQSSWLAIARVRQCVHGLHHRRY